MKRVDLIRLPDELAPGHIQGRAVAVFDVIRATTTIVSALAAGAKEVRVFGSLDAAATAAAGFAGARLLCGEVRCLRPEGFDLGNSPLDYNRPRVEGRTLFMSTTNGTRAIVAASGAARIFAAALVNASAMAQALASNGGDVTLLCAGTNGQIAPEDLIGAGAVAWALRELLPVKMDESVTEAYELSRADLAAALRRTQGGKNVIDAGLPGDLDFCARLDAVTDLVAEIRGDPPTATARVLHE